MCPIIQIAGVPVTAYWLMTVTGLIAAAIYVTLTNRGGRAGHINGYDLATLFFLSMIAAFVGGKALNILIHIPRVLANQAGYAGNPAALWADLTGGRAFYGGLILLGLLWWWYLARYHIPAKDALAISTPGVALFMSIARLGCFFAGCCYGTPVSWGVVFPPGSFAPAGVPLFPSQPAEAALHLALFLVLAVLSRRPGWQPYIFPLYLGGYGAGRFVLEYWRGDITTGLLGLTVSQWIGLALLGLSAALIFTGRRRRAGV